MKCVQFFTGLQIRCILQVVLLHNQLILNTCSTHGDRHNSSYFSNVWTRHDPWTQTIECERSVTKGCYINTNALWSKLALNVLTVIVCDKGWGERPNSCDPTIGPCSWNLYSDKQWYMESFQATRVVSGQHIIAQII